MGGEHFLQKAMLKQGFTTNKVFQEDKKELCILGRGQNVCDCMVHGENHKDCGDGSNIGMEERARLQAGPRAQRA